MTLMIKDIYMKGFRTLSYLTEVDTWLNDFWNYGQTSSKFEAKSQDCIANDFKEQFEIQFLVIKLEKSYTSCAPK